MIPAKFSESSLACKMWQEYLFIRLFIHSFVCMYQKGSKVLTIQVNIK